jgi:hypothetical protein
MDRRAPVICTSFSPSPHGSAMDSQRFTHYNVCPITSVSKLLLAPSSATSFKSYDLRLLDYYHSCSNELVVLYFMEAHNTLLQQRLILCACNIRKRSKTRLGGPQGWSRSFVENKNLSSLARNKRISRVRPVPC